MRGIEFNSGWFTAPLTSPIRSGEVVAVREGNGCKNKPTGGKCEMKTKLIRG